MAIDPVTIPESTPRSAGTVKIVAALLLLCFCISITSGFSLGYFFRQSLEPNGGVPTNTPTPSPTATTAPTTTISLTPTPTEDPYADWTRYVFADCQIRLAAPPSWMSGKRGDEMACGSFRFATEVLDFSTFDDYPGGFIVFLPYVEEDQSIFGFSKPSKEAYLQELEKNKDKEDYKGDRLIGLIEDVPFAGKTAKRATIDRTVVGRANHIFFNTNGKEYVIIWGGKKAALNEETIEFVLNSIQFLN